MTEKPSKTEKTAATSGDVSADRVLTAQQIAARKEAAEWWAAQADSLAAASKEAAEWAAAQPPAPLPPPIVFGRFPLPPAVFGVHVRIRRGRPEYKAAPRYGKAGAWSPQSPLAAWNAKRERAYLATRDRLDVLASLPAGQRTDEAAAEFARLLHQAARALRADDTPSESHTDAECAALAVRLDARRGHGARSL